MGGGSNPYSGLESLYDPYMASIKPYQDAGKFGLNEYRKAIGNFLDQGPVGFENQIMSQYQSSPWATYQTQQVTDAANKAAAAGGFLGTPQEQEALANKVQGIVSQDQQKFYQDAVQPYEYGTGQAANLVNVGQATNQDQLNYLNSIANIRASENEWNNQNRGFGGFMNSLGGLVGIGSTVAGLPGVSNWLSSQFSAPAAIDPEIAGMFSGNGISNPWNNTNAMFGL